MLFTTTSTCFASHGGHRIAHAVHHVIAAAADAVAVLSAIIFATFGYLRVYGCAIRIRMNPSKFECKIQFLEMHRHTNTYCPWNEYTCVWPGIVKHESDTLTLATPIIIEHTAPNHTDRNSVADRYPDLQLFATYKIALKISILWYVVLWRLTRSTIHYSIQNIFFFFSQTVCVAKSAERREKKWLSNGMSLWNTKHEKIIESIREKVEREMSIFFAIYRLAHLPSTSDIKLKSIRPLASEAPIRIRISYSQKRWQNDRQDVCLFSFLFFRFFLLLLCIWCWCCWLVSFQFNVRFENGDVDV